jgi:hypothetical protein
MLSMTIKNALIAIIILQSGAATASSELSAPYLSLMKASIPLEKGNNWRSGYANALNAFCRYMESKSPRNTPTEDAWVEREMGDAMIGPGASQARLDRLNGSIEYARFTIQTTFKKCSALTSDILKNQSARLQAAKWAELAYNLSDPETVKRSAKKLGLFARNYDPEGFENFQTIQQTILQNVLVPMLNE